jgi:actin-like protein 6A
MYCGDETGSFIGDVGSHTSRFGYGGEDSPKYVVPSYVTKKNDKYTVASSCYSKRWAESEMSTALRTADFTQDSADQPVLDPTKYLQQGDSMQDTDAYEQLWQSAFDALYVRDKFKHTKGGKSSFVPSPEGLKADEVVTTAASGVQSSTVRSTITPSEGKCEHPLLVVAPGCTHVLGSAYDQSAQRKALLQMTEIMMEKMDCQALFVAPTPMLAAFSHGRQTALVVDVGASGCRVTPVVDGLVLRQAQRRSGRGGDWLGNVQWKALLEENKILRPRYQQQGINAVAASGGIFHRWAMQDMMFEFRTSAHVKLPQWWYDPTTPFIYPEPKDDASGTGKMAVESPASEPYTYELPDGTLVDLTTRVGKDLCRVPELLFTDDVPYLPNGIDESILDQHPTLSNLPLHKLIHSSLSAVGDIDVRKDLAGSILLTGGSSLFENLEQRLSLEVPRVVSGAYKCKVLASRNSVERSCAAWIGGSVLSSLGSFQQLWLSRTEYDEYGATLATQRFP